MSKNWFKYYEGESTHLISDFKEDHPFSILQVEKETSNSYMVLTTTFTLLIEEVILYTQISARGES